MGKTSIEWTDYSWNPIRARNRATGKVGWFCVHASDGCRGCYAESFNARLGTRVDYKAQNEDKVHVYIDDKVLREPLRWRKPRVVFVCSMTDLFGDFVSDEMIDRVFAIMALSQRQTFIVLTKRAARMRAWFAERWQGTPEHRFADGSVIPAGGETGRRNQVEEAALDISVDTKLEPVRWAWPLPNVWLGVSCEDQANADRRIPDLLATPAAVRLVSAEPLLGPIAFWRNWLDGAPRLDWVIVGGESGQHARAMHPGWACWIRDLCAYAGVAFFFKQWGEWSPHPPEGVRYENFSNAFPAWRVGKARAGRLLDGVEHNARPPTIAERS